MRWVLLVLLACSHKAPSPWIGKSAEELDKDPHLSKLPVKKVMKNGEEARVYEDLPRYRTKAQCQVMGGCLGLPTGCQHHVHLKDDRIISFETKGSCP